MDLFGREPATAVCEISDFCAAFRNVSDKKCANLTVVNVKGSIFKIENGVTYLEGIAVNGDLVEAFKPTQPDDEAYLKEMGAKYEPSLEVPAIEISKGRRLG